jgi:hypothetical protein
MDSIQQARELAKQKYEKYLKEKKEKEDAELAKLAELEAQLIAEEEAKKKVLDAENEAKTLKFTEETELIDVFFIELDETINELKKSDDIFLILQMIQTRIMSVIELLREHNRLPEIKDSLNVLYKILDKSHEDKNKKKDTTYVSQVSNIVKNIFELCEVDIEIETMDTSEDDEFARKLQEEMYTMNFYQDDIIGNLGATGGGVAGGGATGAAGDGTKNNSNNNNIEI